MTDKKKKGSERRFSVYVIELRIEVLNKKKFLEKNLDMLRRVRAFKWG